MNSSQSSSSTFNYTAPLDVAPKSGSPCEQAYDTLLALQDEQATLVAQLAGRLSDVLRSVPPDEANTNNVSEAPQSEMHGRFMAAAARARTINRALDGLMQRITV